MPFGELQSGKENTCFFNGELANLRNGFSRHVDRAGLSAQTCPAAFWTPRVTAEAAQENADMQLVFLALQQVEKTFDSFVLVLGVTLQNQAPLFGSQLSPRHVRRNPAPARPFFCFLEKYPVARFRPRFDGAVVERLALIGHDEIQIEIDCISETLAARTRSVWIVEGKKPGLRFLVECAVILAFESLVEREPLGGIPRIVRDEFENGFALLFAVTNFDGVNQS